MLAVGAAAVALAAAGCSSGTTTQSGGGSTPTSGGGTATQAASPACAGSPTPKAPGSGGTLNVWAMQGSFPTGVAEQLNSEFEAKYPGWKVNYQIQQWSGISAKLNKALTGSNPPDVIEMGNTQAVSYANAGELQDITNISNEFQCSQWNQALKDSVALDNKQFGLPFYGANRTVLYRKDMFAKAGITNPPTTQEEWLADLGKLKTTYASDPEFQSLYLPGREWYTLATFVWDNSGNLATNKNGTYTASLNTPQAKAGIDFYKKLYDTSGTTAPKDTDEATPQQSDVVAKDGGHVASFIGFGYEEAAVVKADPALNDKWGAFPIPSHTAGQTAPVFLGGSDLGIAAKSTNQDAAAAWLALESGAKYQGLLAAGGLVPGTSTDTSGLSSVVTGPAMGVSSKNGRVTPVTPAWATVEGGNNPLKDLLTSVLSGTSVDQAASDANGKLDKILKSGS